MAGPFDLARSRFRLRPLGAGLRAARFAPAPLAEEEEQSILGSVASGAVSGLSAVGNLLDLPGSMVRDVLGGENPLDQWLSPLSHYQRGKSLTGRDVMRRHGLIGRKDTWGNFLGGLAGEILLDPLTYTLGPGQALTRAGELARKAGLLGAVPNLARQAGKSSARYRMGSTLAPLINDISARPTSLYPTLAEDLAGAARSMGSQIPAGASLDEVKRILSRDFPEKLGGMVRFRGPMRWASEALTGRSVFGMGPRSQAVMQALEPAGRAIQGVTRPVRSLFTPSMMGATNRWLEGQGLSGWIRSGEQTEALSRELHPRLKATEAAVRTTGAKIAQALGDSGLLTGEDALANSLDMTRYLEDVEGFVRPSAWSPQVVRALDEMKSLNARIVGEERAVGLLSSELDDVIRHFPRSRQWPSGIPRKWLERGIPLFDTTNPHQIARDPALRGWSQGTAFLQELSTDKQIGEMIERAMQAGRKVAAADRKAIRDAIVTKYTRKYGAEALEHDSDEALEQLTNWVVNLNPEHWKRGVPAFDPNPVNALMRRLTFGKHAIEATNTLYDVVRPHVVSRAVANAEGLSASSWVNLGKLMKDTKLIGPNAPEVMWRRLTDTPAQQQLTDAALDKLAAARTASQQGAGISLAEARATGQEAAWRNIYESIRRDPGQIRQMTEILEANPKLALDEAVVPKNIYDDSTRLMTPFTTPEEVGVLVDAFDQFTQLFKTSVTSLFPAFHVRNWVSGQAQNWFLGNYRGAREVLQSMTDAHKLMAGDRNIAGLGRIFGTSNEEAARRLAQEMYAHRLWGGQGLHHAVSEATSGAAGGLENMLREIPGEMSFGLGTAVRAGGVKGQQRRWKDWVTFWKSRGIMGHTDDVFAPAAIGHNVGNYVEGLNRLAPYIALRKNGFSAAEAARKVMAAQVDYRHLTRFEKSYMRRVAPFYSFTKNVMGPFIEELVTNPGGRLGQTIRATHRARDPSGVVPDYVAETTSIPAPDFLQPEDGSKRFFTGLGLMHEDPLSFIGGKNPLRMIQTGLMEGMSRLNPALKFLPELATNQTFFQRGPVGGRSLDDLDPTVGRTISNLTGRKDAVKNWMLGSRWATQLAEHTLANSPATRALTTIRTLTDPRKRSNFGLPLATQLGTGLRVSDVSPSAQEAILSERVGDLMREFGGRSFTRPFIPQETLQALSPQEREKAMRLLAYQNELARRRRERRQEAELLESR